MGCFRAIGGVCDAHGPNSSSAGLLQLLISRRSRAHGVDLGAETRGRRYVISDPVIDAIAAARGQRDLWVSRAKTLSIITIGYNVLEGIVAVTFGLNDESVALFGFGVDSFIEVASAALVLWRFRAELLCDVAVGGRRERSATFGIGVLFGLLAVMTAMAAIGQLWKRQAPESTVAGIALSIGSLSVMVYLWRAKQRAAFALDSATVRGDAACSLACIKLSMVLLLGSLFYAAVPALWWSDSVAALCLALLIGREGWQMVANSRKSEFKGGCGCTH